MFSSHSSWRRVARQLTVSAAIGVGLGASVLAQGFPDRPIKIIVPFAPGGGNDAIGRAVGQQMGNALGVPVVIENKEGAGGMIGVAAGLKSRNDGYTLTLISNSYTVNAALYKLGFDPVEDITPIGLISRGPLLVVTPRALPVSSAQQLVSLAKTKGEGLSYASSGIGGISHLATEMFLNEAGIRMTHVPYRGTSPALVDTAAGRTEVFFSTPGAVLPYLKDGRLKVLAQTLPTTWSEMPAVPTLREAVGVPDYQVVIWYALIAPKGLPREVQQKLNAALNGAVVNADVERHLKMEGNQAFSGSPEQLMKQIKTEMGTWQKVVVDAKVKAN